MRHPFFDLPLPIVLGHRGASGEAPENTLVAFRKALERGAAVVETDVRPSRESEAVLLHDATLERTTDGVGPVAELALEELRRLDAGFRFRDERGRHPFRGRGLTVPTLREALRELPRARFNVEIKVPAPGLVRRVVEVVRDEGAAARVLLTSHDDRCMTLLREELGRCGVATAVGASAGDVRRYLECLATGDRPPAHPMALQVPNEHLGRAVAGRELVRLAHRHGVQVHVWTVNLPPEAERWLDLGVDGLVTDFPGRIAAVVRGRRGLG